MESNLIIRRLKEWEGKLDTLSKSELIQLIIAIEIDRLSLKEELRIAKNALNGVVYYMDKTNN